VSSRNKQKPYPEINSTPEMALLGTPHVVEGREMATSILLRTATTIEEADRVTGLEEALFREVLALMQMPRLDLLA
jgi:hypothetical protein